MISRKFRLFISILLGIVPLLILEVAAKPLWHPPIYLDAPNGWKYRPRLSIDSQAFELQKGKRKILFDYALRSNKKNITCSIDEITKIASLHELKCVSFIKKKQSRLQKFLIEDPEDKRFYLSIEILQNSSDALNNEIDSLIKTLHFVGKINSLKLLYIDQNSKTAIVIDEVKIPRKIKINDIIIRNNGRVCQIEKDYLVIEEFILNSEGSFQKNLVTVRLFQ